MLQKMFHTIAFCCLCCWHLTGVFSVDVKSVSVKEGDSVTLKINVTELQTNDEIKWRFGTEGSLIAEINGETSDICTGHECKERFRDRLKLDQTGSLTIMNTRNTDSGLYEAEISLSKSEDKNRFSVTVYGGFGDTNTVKSVSVKEGDSVTLQINNNEIHTNDEIKWRFGTEGSLIAEINGETSDICADDECKERFRDRLKLDQTGSLTIMNIRNTDSGLYEVEISLSSSETKYRFNVTVYDCTFCCHVPEAVTRLVISVLVGVAAAFMVVYDIISRKVEQERTQQNSLSSSDPH
ncbi:uncharacterized protein LOC122327463 [Puntigrus tetrazona]|uniref:uncharacterized protein LOC122327463 n=1 Tax=Puntigrus tetrazona TaxID=1606681 RepID=UPI001C88F607|nr:uncharacterized protein LOC122327463 [Puntigrus tetrazona]